LTRSYRDEYNAAPRAGRAIIKNDKERVVMNQRRVWILTACVMGALLIGCQNRNAAEQGSIDWVESFEAGMKEAADTGKLVMVDLYTDWCGWCKRLDREVYTNGEVAKLAKDFVCIKLNPEKDPENGRKFKVQGFPTIIFTDSAGKEIRRVVGYKPADKFLKEMERAKEDAEK
jgi:thiol:disulfide interchange protein